MSFSYQGEEISNRNFPVSYNWLFLQLITKFFFILGIAIFALFLDIYFGWRNNDIFQWLIIPVIVFVIVYLSNIAFSFQMKRQYEFRLNPSTISHKAVKDAEELTFPYENIDKVVIEQGPLEKLFGIASVLVILKTSFKFKYKDVEVDTNQFGLMGQSTANAEKLKSVLDSIIH